MTLLLDLSLEKSVCPPPFYSRSVCLSHGILSKLINKSPPFLIIIRINLLFLIVLNAVCELVLLLLLVPLRLCAGFWLLSIGREIRVMAWAGWRCPLLWGHIFCCPVVRNTPGLIYFYLTSEHVNLIIFCEWPCPDFYCISVWFPFPQAIIYEGQDKNPEMNRVLLTHEIMCR